MSTSTGEEIDGLIKAYNSGQTDPWLLCGKMADAIRALMAELADHERSFKIRWDANQRAIKRWQEAHPGNDLVWPDQADLCVWLMERLTAERIRWRAAAIRGDVYKTAMAAEREGRKKAEGERDALEKALRSFMETYHVDRDLCNDPESAGAMDCWKLARIALEPPE
jgi:hypothetical protein